MNTCLFKPYIRPCDIAKVTGLHRSTVYRILKDNHVPKYPRFGYLTADIIKAFKLKSFIEEVLKDG